MRDCAYDELTTASRSLPFAELYGLVATDLEMTEEEKADIQKKRARMVFEAGNITGIIVGTVLVLLLVTILFSMVYFVRSDITRNFTLFRIQF